MDQLTVEQFRTKMHPKKNENVSYAFQKISRSKYFTFARLSIIEYNRNVCALLCYIHMSTYNQIYNKRLRIPIIHFHILVGFNIQRRFCASLSLRVSYAIRPKYK